MPHLVNLETDIEYEFDFLSFSFDSLDALYVETDIDDEFFYTTLNQEFYLFFNCRFFFDLYGGEQTLDFIDFLDFTIYKINDKKNYKNIYKTFIFLHPYDQENSYLLYNFNEDFLNDSNISYYLNNINNDDIYNIARSIEAKNKVKLAQRLKYLQYKYKT
jgi:hypothetical protein